jgi:anoctamin-10
VRLSGFGYRCGLVSTPIRYDSFPLFLNLPDSRLQTTVLHNIEPFRTTARWQALRRRLRASGPLIPHRGGRWSPTLSRNQPPTHDVVADSCSVDYIIDYRFATTVQAKAEARFTELIRALHDVGLVTEVRNSDNCAVLIFVKIASQRHLHAEVYRSRVQDWLYGVRTTAPERQINKAIDAEPITEAERLRLVYMLITKPRNEGGAGITPKQGDWEGVESIFSPQDHTFNKAWIREWSTKYFLDNDDLNMIRNRFGEKIAFYFAFLQSYFMFLMFPAAFGFSCWVLFGYFSPVYAIVNSLWSIVFIEYWKKQEIDLAVQWGVNGVSRIQRKRPQFRHESVVKDVVTGEEVKIYPPLKRLARQLLQVPFALCVATVLGGVIIMCFGIELFINEVYSGPFKSYLSFLPTIILTTVMPMLSALLTGFAQRLTELENYETQDGTYLANDTWWSANPALEYEASMVQKVFVLNFITSYMPLFLTSFVYMPFAHVFVPHLDIFKVTVKPFTQNEKHVTVPRTYKVNRNRLKTQMFYFTITGQIVNFLLEVVVPYAKRKGFQTAKKVKANAAGKAAGKDIHHTADDLPEESAFLARVRNEAELGMYDVTGDFREMVVQFGYLSMFSVAWPLTAVSYLINDWIELRGDALKIAIECQRPVPWRADGIGPWLDALGFLTWIGSLTSSALVFMFNRDGTGPDGNPSKISGWGLLLTMFFAEHIYLVLALCIRKALSRFDSPGLQKERAERFAIRRQYLEEALGIEEADRMASGGIAAGEKLDRTSLEEDARQSTLRGHGTPEERFWQRQRAMVESIAVGRRYIARAAPSEGKKQL